MTQLHNSPCLATVVEVLDELGAEIEMIGAVLCRDPEFAGRHMRELQAIDLIAQTQHALAALPAAGLAEHAIEAISIDGLRKRLSAVLPVPPKNNPENYDQSVKSWS